MRFRKPASLIFGFFVVMATACSEPPKKETPKKIETPAEPEAPETLPTTTDYEHRVKRGDSLWKLAKLYQMKQSVIRKANGLGPDGQMIVGERMKIPQVSIARLEEIQELERQKAIAQNEESLEKTENEALSPDLEKEQAQAEAEAAIEAKKRAAKLRRGRGVTHTLEKGETLWAIARRYDTSMNDIIAANELSDDGAAQLSIGAKLFIPGARRIRKEKKVAKKKKRGFGVSVRKGETVWHLARAFNISVSELMATNGWSQRQASSLRVGQDITIPGKRRSRNSKSSGRPITSKQVAAKARAKSLGLGTRNAASRLMMGNPKAKWIEAAGGNTMPGTLLWPVTRGRFVRGYGSGEGAYHRAVDIAGNMGWNVRASAAGIVGYAGNGVRGYGNIVLIVHPGGWVTMYAHNSINFVVSGQQVRRGEIIAEVGSTGISRGPHVHYEFMAGGKVCDPASLFRPGVRHKTRLARIPPKKWVGTKPKVVKCGNRMRHPRSKYVIHEGEELKKHR